MGYEAYELSWTLSNVWSQVNPTIVIYVCFCLLSVFTVVVIITIIIV